MNRVFARIETSARAAHGVRRRRIQDVEIRESLPGPKCAAEDLRGEARSPHSQQKDTAEAILADLSDERIDPRKFFATLGRGSSQPRRLLISRSSFFQTVQSPAAMRSRTLCFLRPFRAFRIETLPALQIDRVRERILFHDFSETSFPSEGRPAVKERFTYSTEGPNAQREEQGAFPPAPGGPSGGSTWEAIRVDTPPTAVVFSP